MGGDEFQFLVLIGADHELQANTPNGIAVDGNNVIWSANFLLNATRKQLREKLDEIVPHCPDKNKNLANAFLGGIDSAIQKHKKEFPLLFNAIDNKRYLFDENFSTPELFVMASIICGQLSMRLDVNDISTIATTGTELTKFPSEIVFTAFRNQVGIERLVKFNLNESPVLGEVLRKIRNKIKE